MRSFLLLLLLFNALVFAYQRWIIEPDAPVAATHREQLFAGLLLASAPEVPAVVMAAEPMPAPVADETQGSEVEDGKAAPIAMQCARIGPFPGLAEAQIAERTLRERGAAVRLSSEEGSVWVGHWVQLVGFDTRERAEAARLRLAAAGITDAYIVPGSDDARISFGVFRARTSADRAVQQARNLGFTARIEDRYQPGTNIWLWLQQPENASTPPGDLKSLSGQILRMESLPCGEAGY